MDLPKPPDDIEQRNIINKLANFVARNGPEFELMTKTKQKDNPRFSFLFGGEFFNYYQYKVTSEQAVIKQQQQQQQQSISQVSPSWQPVPGSSPLGILPQSGPPPPGVQLNPVLSQQPAQSAQTQPGAQQPPTAPPLIPATGTLEQQITTLQQNLSKLQKSKDEQIRQSESNLAAQYQNMIQQQGPQIDQCIKNAKESRLQQLTVDCELTLEELDRAVQPIIDSCTKDGILNCKNWIMQKSMSFKHCELITQYILKRIIGPDSQFPVRLHLIYLMNDLLHHCMRKGHNDLKVNIEKIVIPTFCTTIKDCDEKGRDKLLKLLNLWERHNYFNAETIELLKNPGPSLVSYKTNLMNEYKDEVSALTMGVQTQYNQLQNQHQEFVTHLNNQIQVLQTQLQSLVQQKANQIQAQAQARPPSRFSSEPPSPISVVNSGIDKAIVEKMDDVQQIPTAVSQPRRFSRFSQPHPTPPAQPPSTAAAPPPHLLAPPDLSRPPPDFSRPPPDFQGQGFPPGGASQPPPSGAPGPLPFVPDLSRPPPGFPAGPPPGAHGPPIPPSPAGPPGHMPPTPQQPMQMEIDLTPSVPYYELPAGLMAPLVQLEETEYKPLNPRDIRLPPPMPPTDRLLAAVEAFYGPPSHDRPRDTDGWEKLGLYEFFKAKHRCKKMKEEREADMMRWGRTEFRGRSRSPEPSPPRRSPSPPPPPRRKYRDGRSRSRSRERQRYRSPSGETSRSPERFSQRSRSPERFQERSRSPDRSPSPVRRKTEDSPLPYQPSSRSPSPVPMKRSISRSPTPPSTLGFGGGAPQPEMSMPQSSGNKGHQLMLKMGWGGKGLGLSEQGRLDPVEAAEVREKQDMFKGIGVQDYADPFEAFRKNKAKGYVQRMRARDEMRDAKRDNDRKKGDKDRDRGKEREKDD